MTPTLSVHLEERGAGAKQRAHQYAGKVITLPAVLICNPTLLASLADSVVQARGHG